MHLQISFYNFVLHLQFLVITLHYLLCTLLCTLLWHSSLSPTALPFTVCISLHIPLSVNIQNCAQHHLLQTHFPYILKYPHQNSFIKSPQPLLLYDNNCKLKNHFNIFIKPAITSASKQFQPPFKKKLLFNCLIPHLPLLPRLASSEHHNPYITTSPSGCPLTSPTPFQHKSTITKPQIPTSLNNTTAKFCLLFTRRHVSFLLSFLLFCMYESICVLLSSSQRFEWTVRVKSAKDKCSRYIQSSCRYHFDLDFRFSMLHMNCWIRLKEFVHQVLLSRYLRIWGTFYALNYEILCRCYLSKVNGLIKCTD